jgi:4-amino-4-deoxy-L-arabinose transferase-like glycosyltransferase
MKGSVFIMLIGLLTGLLSIYLGLVDDDASIYSGLFSCLMVAISHLCRAIEDLK